MTEPASEPAAEPGTLYRIALNAPSAQRVVQHVIDVANRAGAESPPDVELVPSNLEPGDTVAVGEQVGTDGEDAVERLLLVVDTDKGIHNQRRQAAAAAAHDGVRLTFVVIAVRNVGAVPVELDRRLKIG